MLLSRLELRSSFLSVSEEGENCSHLTGLPRADISETRIRTNADTHLITHWPKGVIHRSGRCGKKIRKQETTTPTNERCISPDPQSEDVGTQEGFLHEYEQMSCGFSLSNNLQSMNVRLFVKTSCQGLLQKITRWFGGGGRSLKPEASAAETLHRRLTAPPEKEQNVVI